MGRKKPWGFKDGLKKGAWTPLEDQTLIDYIKISGEGRWNTLSKRTGLKRCGKSCRLRWLNYLRPDIKRGNISDEEEELIIRLHKLLGNRWCLIAGRLPGRTDNEIKNYWNTNLSKKLVIKDQATNIKPLVPHHQCCEMVEEDINVVAKESSHGNPQAQAAMKYEDHQGIMSSSFKGSLLCDFGVDVEIGQICLSELLEPWDEVLDVGEFNSTMCSTFGEDFCDVEEACHVSTTDQPSYSCV